MGADLLMYNTKTFPTPPDSWQVVLLSRICRTARAIKAGYRLMMPYLHCGCRVVRQSHAATVGHSDPYQLTEEQYQAVLKVLRVNII